MRTATRKALLGSFSILVATALATTVACRREKKEEVAPPPGETAQGAPQPLPGNVQVVEVVLTGTSFQLGGAVPPGLVRFHVTNASREEHSFAIDDGSRRTQLEDPLGAGKSADLVASLSAGSYRIFCPMKNHGNEVARQLVVTTRAERR